MIRQNASFYFFDDPDVKSIFAKAYPAFEIRGRGREHFRRIVIPRMAENIRNDIVQGIGNSFYAITSDGWSQPTKSPHLQSITVHWIDKNFSRNDKVMLTFSMTERHTGENISKNLSENLLKNGLSNEKVICLVRDDASNMQSATKIMGVISFQCACHFLNICIQNALNSKEIAELVGKVKEWTKECRISNGSKILKRHQQQQKLPENKLLMPVPTRWNSIYHMLLAFKENRKALLSIELERAQKEVGIFQTKRPRIQNSDTISLHLPQINADDFEFLRLLCPILKIFDDATLRFSKEQSTASEILPVLRRIRDFLQGSIFQVPVAQFANILAEAINDRVKKLVDNSLLRISSLLDPRFAFDETIFTKANWSMIEEELIEFSEKVLTENDILEGNNDINENEINNDVTSTASSDESPKYDIWRNPISPGSISLPSAGESSLSKRLTVQLGAFRAIDRPCHDADLFTWWHRNGPQYPDLQRLARIVHVIPSASICSERLFSKAGLIYANTLRNKLSAEMVDKILVIKANLDKLMMGPSALLEKEEKDDEG